jgi:hypothetical protein
MGRDGVCGGLFNLHFHFLQQIPLPSIRGEIHEYISKYNSSHTLHLPLGVESTYNTLSSWALNFKLLNQFYIARRILRNSS